MFDLGDKKVTIIDASCLNSEIHDNRRFCYVSVSGDYLQSNVALN